jgi:hypothetical protein
MSAMQNCGPPVAYVLAQVAKNKTKGSSRRPERGGAGAGWSESQRASSAKWLSVSGSVCDI